MNMDGIGVCVDQVILFHLMGHMKVEVVKDFSGNASASSSEGTSTSQAGPAEETSSAEVALGMIGKPITKYLAGQSMVFGPQETGDEAPMHIIATGDDAVLFMYRLATRKPEEIISVSRRAGLYPYQPESEKKPKGDPMSMKKRPSSILDVER